MGDLAAAVHSGTQAESVESQAEGRRREKSGRTPTKGLTFCITRWSNCDFPGTGSANPQPTILTQFDLKHLSSPETYIQTFLGQLRYDLKYLEAGQTHSFTEDLKLLFREAEGSTKSCKPVLFEGRHLECRGCVTGWEESTVLVLTVSTQGGFPYIQVSLTGIKPKRRI